jgi:hypothetical protein
VRHVRGRAGSTINQLRVVCDNISDFYTDAHAPHRVGSRLGSATGVLFNLRCSGNGALSSFDGRTTTGALVRLGGMCRATDLGPPFTPRAERHPASNWLGGTNGTAFSSTSTPTSGCNPNELMVGLRVRGASGSFLTAIGGICADANNWANASATPRNLTLKGATTGTITQIMCPASQFLVGIDAWGTGTVNGLHAVCAAAH